MTPLTGLRKEELLQKERELLSRSKRSKDKKRDEKKRSKRKHRKRLVFVLLLLLKIIYMFLALLALRTVPALHRLQVHLAIVLAVVAAVPVQRQLRQVTRHPVNQMMQNIRNQSV